MSGVFISIGPIGGKLPSAIVREGLLAGPGEESEVFVVLDSLTNLFEPNRCHGAGETGVRARVEEGAFAVIL